MNFANKMKMKEKERFFTASMARGHLTYAHETGLFTRKNGSSKKNQSGLAGTICKGGYVHIMIGTKMFKGHRLAWLMHYGEWPDGQVDHINGDRADNRICNLRIASTSQNKANGGAYSTNSSGYKGVTYKTNDRGTKKWVARITVNYNRIELGRFYSAEDAAEAYRIAASKYFGEFARTA